MAWHYNQLVVSFLLMIVLLVTLVKINNAIGSDSSLISRKSRAFLAIPFQIYFGWICVATIANISILQSAYGLNNSIISQEYWTVLKLIAVVGLAYTWGWKKGRGTFLLVFAWAGFGILSSNSGIPIIKVSTMILVAVSLVAGIWTLVGFSSESKRSVIMFSGIMVLMGYMGG